MSEPLQLVVLLVIEELQRGDFLVWPFADPTLIAYGRTRGEAIEQQELFLREHLAKLGGGGLAGFDPHAEVTLEQVEVPLQRDDLPERVRIDQPLLFPCVIVPDSSSAADVWAVVLNLRHAIWIPGGGEDAELRNKRIRSEIERIVAARELDGREFLSLLRGADPFTLERLIIEVDREERAGAEARAAARRRRALERNQSDARALLGRIGTSLIEEIRLRRPAPVLHREREMASLDALLRGPERLALMLVGPELAGKTAVVHGLVQRWLSGSKSKGRLATLPELVATSGAQLVAGQSGFGQLEQRVNDVMAAAEMLDVILYFDNLADLFARTSGELGDVAASMRPWLERGRVRVLGEISPEALEHHEKRHVGFFAYMNRIAVEALDARQTHAILEARANHDRKVDAERPTLSRDAVTPLVDLAERYFSYQAFPGKALRFYASLRATHEGELDDDGKPKPIGPDEVYRGFSIHSGIPMFLLREDRNLEYRRIVEFFHERVIGQHEAIGRIAETLCTVKAGLQPAAKPLATFLFVGPTGVGKTEVAKTLARFLFGSPERTVRFDMSEYMDPLAAERLIRGTDRDDGVLTRRVRQQPFCVILLDEIEKAHPAVFDLLLQVCGEGRLSDARGRTTWFHNAIIIMTSNLGAAHRRPSSGFGGGGKRDSDPAEAERYYLEQVDTHFRPEFVNRIDRVIPFHPLDREQIHAVAEVSLARVRERDGIGERGIALEVAGETLDRLAREGYSDTYGARALRRELEDRLVAPIARTLAPLGDRSETGTIRVREAGTPTLALGKRERMLVSETQDNLAIDVSVPTGRTARRTLDALTRVSALRRSAAAASELAPVRELRDRVRVLVAELGYGAHERKGERSAWEHSAELGRLQAEHGRIVGTVDRIDTLRESIDSAEELTIAALYEGEPAEVYQEAAEDAYRTLRVAIVDALLLENERHSITVHLQEQDPRGALLIYLLPLLERLQPRGWRASFHVLHDREKADVAWPHDRQWGPPRSAAWLHEQLTADLEPDAPARKFRDVLMCIDGRHCGALLQHQLGLFRFEHRYVHERKQSQDRRPTHLLVRFVSARATIERAEWAREHLQTLPKPLRRAELDATPKRAHFCEDALVRGSLFPSSTELDPAELWSRLEEVMFTPLVERAFAGEADEEAGS
ncbi:MAG TPA: AAA family ATPase [Enhygromyxa sp.]|nr:AAA family ATPase [Enhygromyxa sp.]